MTMFLSMLAGDVASAHGHEFSARRTPTPPAGTTQGQPRRLTIPRAVLPSTRQRSPHGPSPLGPRARRATTPVRSASIKLTMAELREEPEEDAQEEEQDSRHSEDSLSGYTMPGAFHGSMNTTADISASLIMPLSVPIAPTEPLVQTLIALPEPTFVPPTILSPITPTTEKPSLASSTKRARGPKTTLRFAHPPPPTRPLGKKGILRPKVLLQLQQRRESGFHKPLYEVLPANRFAPSTKLGQKLQRLRRGKDGLEADDLVVVNAEDYHVSDTSSEEIEISDSKAVVGVISPSSTASVTATVAEFSLDNTVWRIKAGPNGASYIIESQGDAPQTARWYVPKRKRSSVIIGGSTAPPVPEARKFYFTTILPDTKQHPIIASMTEASLEISESYTVASREEEIITDELTRKLIVVSAAWVFFMEGWSSSYKVNETSNLCARPLHSRAMSMPVEPTRRRSIFTQSPSRSPSRPTVEGLSSPSLRSSKAPSPDLQNASDTTSISEATVLTNRTMSQSTEATIISDRKVSQTSQITVPDTSHQDAQPEPEPNATTIAAPEPAAASKPRALGPAVVPRVRAQGDIEDRSVKRRSWSHHEVPHWVRQGGLGSLSRSMSSRLKRERPSVVPPEAGPDVPIVSIEDHSSPRQERGLRHVQRISHQLRHLRPTRTDALNMTATVLRPYTPVPHPSSAPASRPTTAKSFAGTEIITVENADPFDVPPQQTSGPCGPETVASSLRQPPSHILDGSASAAQSTETLPDPAQVSWWQQYDQFIVQDQHRHFQKLERNISPVMEDPQGVEAEDQTMSSLTSTVSPTSPLSSAAGSRRLSSWKEKLKTKFHV